MSFRGGRGGGAGRGGLRPGGPMANNMSYEEYKTLNLTGAPSLLYPETELPEAQTIVDDEKLSVRFFKEIQQSLYSESPFYIVAKEKLVGSTGVSNTNNDGIERYSDKWKPKRKVAASLQDLRTDEAFFPEELLPVLRGENPARKKKKIQTFDINKFLDMNVALAEGDAEGEDKVGSEAGSEEESEQDMDEAFDDDDGNDYEDNYFSGGENDFEDLGEPEDVY